MIVLDANILIRAVLGRRVGDLLATALALSCPNWTEDADFFGTGASVWTTNRVELFLRSQSEPTASSKD